MSPGSDCFVFNVGKRACFRVSGKFSLKAHSFQVRFSVLCPGLPCAPYQSEQPPTPTPAVPHRLCFPSIPPPHHKHPSIPCVPQEDGRGCDRTAVPVSGRSGSGSKLGCPSVAGRVSSAGNIPKQCQCQLVPSSLHWSHPLALLIQPRDGASSFPWGKDPLTASHQLQLQSLECLLRSRLFNIFP